MCYCVIVNGWYFLHCNQTNIWSFLIYNVNLKKYAVKFWTSFVAFVCRHCNQKKERVMYAKAVYRIRVQVRISNLDHVKSYPYYSLCNWRHLTRTTNWMAFIQLDCISEKWHEPKRNEIRLRLNTLWMWMCIGYWRQN